MRIESFDTAGRAWADLRHSLDTTEFQADLLIQENSRFGLVDTQMLARHAYDRPLSQLGQADEMRDAIASRLGESDRAAFLQAAQVARPYQVAGALQPRPTPESPQQVAPQRIGPPANDNMPRIGQPANDNIRPPVDALEQARTRAEGPGGSTNSLNWGQAVERVMQGVARLAGRAAGVAGGLLIPSNDTRPTVYDFSSDLRGTVRLGEAQMRFERLQNGSWVDLGVRGEIGTDGSLRVDANELQHAYGAPLPSELSSVIEASRTRPANWQSLPAELRATQSGLRTALRNQGADQCLPDGNRGVQGHHIIGADVVGRNAPFFRSIYQADPQGFATDAARNVIPLPSQLNPANDACRDRPRHNTSHAEYDAAVESQIQRLAARMDPVRGDLNSAQALAKVRELQDLIRNEMLSGRYAGQSPDAMAQWIRNLQL